MDPASLAIGIISVFKDTYLVGRFVYTTINSGLKHAEERTQIIKELRHELLLLRSFGRWFVDSRGIITTDSSLNKAWLEDIRDRLEDLRIDLAEYRDVAEKNDPQYVQFSPMLHLPYTTSGVIEFDINQELPAFGKPSWLAKWFSSKPLKNTQFYIGGEWALFRKRKLEKLVVKFHKRNKKLQQILQTAVPAQILSMDHGRQQNERWVKSPDLENLGIKGHLEIAQLQQGPLQEETKLLIENAEIGDASSMALIHPSKLRLKKAKNNVQIDRVLVEFKPYGPGRSGDQSNGSIQNGDQTTASRNAKQVEKLAAMLRASGIHQLGTLPLRGYIDQPEHQRHAFLFDYPEGADVSSGPVDLHSLIKNSSGDGPPPWPLALRFSTALKLAEILGALNNDGWVHKSVRSQSISFFRDTRSKDLLANQPYLVNFEYSRLHDRTTYLDRDEDSAKDLYRHPSLQESDRQDSFTSVHDIYALGVVLLEIALWQTAAEIVQNGMTEIQRRDPWEVRRWYLKIARTGIPWRMGAAYAEAVEACLGDEYAADFVIPERDAFRKKVIDKLSPKMLHKGLEV